MTDPLTIDSEISAAEQIAQLQNELDRLRLELGHSQRLATLGFLAAGVAHEINNILTPVLAYAQLAASNPDDKRFQAKALEKAMIGTQLATQITEAMLGFASKAPQPKFANVYDTIQASIKCIGRDPKKDRISIEIDVDRDICVQISQLSLQQVFMNLILNAVEVFGRGGGRIDIRGTQDHAGNTVITVTDNGPGIPKNILKNLFDPFVTTEPRTSKSKTGGSGLGLAICKRLLEEVSGTIGVATGSNGTVFTITLCSAMNKAIAV